MQTRKPSLLFIFADQWRQMDAGCYGNREVQTAAFDRLAREGTRCTHAFATVPVCGPNRACLLTGMFPLTNGVPANDLALPIRCRSLGDQAKAAGARTGYIGKWHLDGLPRTKFTPPGPRRFGFDFWAAYNCSHAYSSPRYYRDDPEPVILSEGYEPAVQTDLALEFLQGTAENQSFCLMLSWGPPHDPYADVPLAYRQRYRPDELTLRPNVVVDAGNPIAAKLECRPTLANYYAAITALDDQLGRLMAALGRAGRAEDTLVVVTSDHGDMLWSHGWMKKSLPHEESIAVPLVLRWPGKIPAGVASDQLLSTVDLVPSLCGLLGWAPPPQVEGMDLSAALESGRPHERPEGAFMGIYASTDESAKQGAPAWRGIRTQRHTYAELPGRVPWLLFDNEVDPFQETNLVDEAACRPLRSTLAGHLGRWMARQRDPGLVDEPLMRSLGLSTEFAARQQALGPVPRPSPRLPGVRPPATFA